MTQDSGDNGGRAAGKSFGEQTRASGDQTRQALIAAALKLFGEKGFDGTSTREIAAAANANIGSIAYHFGGKEQLRLACADFIVKTISTLAGEALAEAEQDGAEPANFLPNALERLVTFLLTRPEAGMMVEFILRELQHPTEALDSIYSGVFEPVHKRLCQVWANTTGEPADSERTKLTVFALIGQVVYFRIAREAVRRRMGWSEFGPGQLSAILDVAQSNLASIIAGRRPNP